MTEISRFFATCAHSKIAETCGIPAPEIMRVVQMSPRLRQLLSRRLRLDDRFCSFGGYHVASNDGQSSPRVLDALHSFQHASRMSVCGVNGDGIDSVP